MTYNTPELLLVGSAQSLVRFSVSDNHQGACDRYIAELEDTNSDLKELW